MNARILIAVFLQLAFVAVWSYRIPLLDIEVGEEEEDEIDVNAVLDGNNNITDVNLTNSYMICNPNASCRLELDMQLELGLLLEQDDVVRLVPNTGLSSIHNVNFQLGMGLSLEPRPGLYTQHELRATLDVALKLEARVKLDPRIKVNLRFKLLLRRPGLLNSTEEDDENSME